VWTCFGEGADLVDPLPFILAKIAANVATQELVARHNVVGVNQAMKMARAASM